MYMFFSLFYIYIYIYYIEDADSLLIRFDERVPFFGEKQFVRLTGLKAHQLNDRAGTITNYNRGTKRFGVLLHGELSPNAIKCENIVKYEPNTIDKCANCLECLNLFAFPACLCKFDKVGRFILASRGD